MGVRQSKEELLYHQVGYGNIEGIKALHREGAGLEWVDNEGRTPLMVACMMPNGFPVVEALLKLGANVHAFRPGFHNGTPLHHAAKKGLAPIVDLLLLHGANPFIVNDNCQTAGDIAREHGFAIVVRTIEARISLFSGWLRLKSQIPQILDSLLSPWLTKKMYAIGDTPVSNILETLTSSSWLTKKLWAVVIPSCKSNHSMPPKFVLVMYSDLQASQPSDVVSLWKANIEEPNFNVQDPVIVISDKGTRYKLLSANEGDKQQLMYFYNACRGISQQGAALVSATPSCPALATSPIVTPSSATEDDDLALAINASIQTALEEGLSIHDAHPPPITTFSCSKQSLRGGPSTSEAGTSTHSIHQPHDHVIHNAGTEAPGDAPIRNLFTDPNSISLADPVKESVAPACVENNEGINASGSCVICLDASVEGACIPCGHMAGCMSCLNEIKAKNWGCPVCRTKIDQVVKLYAV